MIKAHETKRHAKPARADTTKPRRHVMMPAYAEDEIGHVVHENPDVATARRIAATYSRALIYANGRLLAWTGNLVHRDVREQCGGGEDCLSLRLGQGCVTVWGTEAEDGRAFAEEPWLGRIRSNRILRGVYGSTMTVDYENWV